MNELPALSIRQPWAWLIVNGYKPIENRTWRTEKRGRIQIHAGGAMTYDEYADARKFAESIRQQLPKEWQDLRWWPEVQDLERGGIVGEADLVDCVSSERNPWFTGPYGFVLENARKLPFKACSGALKFFEPAKVTGPRQQKLLL